MKKKSSKTRPLVLMIIALGLVVLGQELQRRCSDGPEQPSFNSAININKLYPWPGAKIPFACHTMTFLKSPFSPRSIGWNETVFKEDGFRILGGTRREGVVVAHISIAGDLLPIFDEKHQYGKMPAFANSVSLYVDGNKLKIGYVAYREPDLEYDFATILDPFLWPGEHVGKIVILLPSGETMEYEWHFEITWW